MEQDVRLLKKSAWKRVDRKVERFFCPICQTDRQLHHELHPGRFKHVLPMLLVTAVLMLVLWPWFGAKGAVLFVPLWALFEILHLMIIRGALVCKNCGFDPYLAKANINRAAAAVKKHYEDRTQPLTVDPPKR